MKESISYAFLLNIIITFIFICFAVIMGIFSYYRAFRANTAILNAIEKYEGFNCLSESEANKSLQNLGYNVPFKANKKNGTNGTLLTSDDTKYSKLGYSVIYFDNASDNKLATGKFTYANREQTVNKEYQYGVYTYMYIDLPIVNGLLKIPVFGKTNKMFEFRDLVYYNNTYMMDTNLLITKSISFEQDRIKTLKIASKIGTGSSYTNPRLNYKLDTNLDGVINSRDATQPPAQSHSKRECGIFIDYSIYGGIR